MSISDFFHEIYQRHVTGLYCDEVALCLLLAPLRQDAFILNILTLLCILNFRDLASSLAVACLLFSLAW